MGKLSKKTRITVAVILSVVVCAMLVVGYITKHKNDDTAEEAPASESIPADAGGPLLDAPPDESWADDEATGYNGFTTRAQLGSDAEAIGVLTIEKIGVSVYVYDSDEGSTVEDMKRGAAHYRTTSYWDGNIGFAAHIGNASYSFFERLHELKAGDKIIYETELGTRIYAVAESVNIDEADWSRLERTEDNRLTLTTCIEGQETQRLCVQAVEI